jgi:HPt (histidine-containing phosphotransfer) domain-containing protein
MTQTLPIIQREYLDFITQHDATLAAELVEQMLSDALPLVATLVIAAETGQIEAAHRATHTLKGIAGSIGATRIKHVARQIEGAMLAETPIAGIVPTLIAEIDALRSANRMTF